MNNSHQQYIDLYEAHRDLIERHSCEALNAHRAEAARLLAAQGLPDRGTERYKYTDAAAAFEPDFGLNLQRIVPQISTNDFAALYALKDAFADLPIDPVTGGISIGALRGYCHRHRLRAGHQAGQPGPPVH